MQSRADRPFDRITGAAAIGFAFLIVTANLVLVPAGMPAPGAPAAEAIEFFTGTTDPTGRVAFVLPAAWVLATLFGAGALAAVLHAKRPPTAGWAYSGFAGVLLQNITFTAVVALRLAMSTMSDRAGITTLWALHEALFGLNGTFLALAMAGLGTAGHLAGLLPGWHFLLGCIAAALQFTSATLTPLILGGDTALTSIGSAGWLLWVAWLLGYGGVLLRRNRAKPPVPPAVQPGG
ncbi:MAG: 2-oxoglutarate/malate transporter [Nocardia sp.]|nr:2-oxoglutarate/malate transporter [Nocardia sp.]